VKKLKRQLGAKNFLLPLSAITLLGLAFDVLFGVHFAGQLASKKFSQVDGKITSSKIVFDTSGSENAHCSVAAICYAYNVNGFDFNGNRLRYVSIDAPENLVATYKVGDAVTVFYNPKKPEDAVLSAGVTSADWRRLAWQILLNLALAASWLLFLCKRESVKKSPVSEAS
jgi:hypothetical protein